jgi:serine/threonine-protein kinase
LYDDDDDEDFATVVDASLFSQPDIPDYDVLAQFGHFEILGRIARGGMAEVYLARDRHTDGSVRHVVVKRVLPEFEDNQEFLDMFLEEGKMATRLYHPNVCHVYEIGEIEGATFMALEWVYGIPLRTVIRRSIEKERIPPAIGAKIIAKVAAALHYVHNAKGVHGKSLNIIHRDVSPHNVMISWDGNIKLLDFGIAKTTAKESQTDAGVLKGKYSYLSPEQARGQRVDPRADIFALGICLYETLTGQPLYHRETVLNTLTAITEEPVPSARAVNPDVSAKLDEIVKKALAKEPEDRFATAGDMQQAIDEALISQGEYVDPVRISKFLDTLFDETDKQPLAKRAQKLTGSFQGTPSVSSGSFGPFSSAPRAAAKDDDFEIDLSVDDLVEEPPAPALEPKPTWRPPGKQLTDAAPLPKPEDVYPQRKVPLWVIGLLFVLFGIAAGALTAYLANS